jgi:hypothetical protein
VIDTGHTGGEPLIDALDDDHRGGKVFGKIAGPR